MILNNVEMRSWFLSLHLGIGMIVNSRLTWPHAKTLMLNKEEKKKGAEKRGAITYQAWRQGNKYRNKNIEA